MSGILLTDLVLLFIGHSILRWLWPQGKKLIWIYIPFAYFLGEFSIIIWMYFLAITGIPFSLMTIDTPLCLMAMFSLSPVHKTNSTAVQCCKADLQTFDGPFGLSRGIALIISAYIIIQIIYVFWRASVLPVFEYDVVWRIGLKAKVFFFDQGIEKLKYLPYPKYALGGPFILSWAALHAGVWNEARMRLIPAMEMLMFIVLFRGVLRVFLSPVLSILGTGLLVSANVFTYYAAILYNDFHTSVYLCASIFTLILWNKFKQQGLLFLAGILICGAGLFKMEAFMYLFLFIVTWRWAFPIRKKDALRDVLMFTVPSAGGLLCHFVLCSTRGYVDQSLVIKFIGMKGFSGRVETFFSSLSDLIYISWDWNILWIILTVLLILNVKSQRKIPEVRTIGFFLSVFMYYLFIAAVFTDRSAVLGGALAFQTLPRMVLHFFPLVPALICFLLANILTQQNSLNNEHYYRSQNN